MVNWKSILILRFGIRWKIETRKLLWLDSSFRSDFFHIWLIELKPKLSFSLNITELNGFVIQ